MYDIDHATPELFTALAAAQGKIENAAKNSSNPHFKSKYADLAEVLNTIRPVFAEAGLSLIQSPAYDGALAHVTTVLAHAGGGYITTTASCQPAKSDAQGIGSATTYLRRYSAAAVAGIAQEDDDGNAAAHNGKPKAVAAVRQPVTKTSPMDGVWDALDPEMQTFLRAQANKVIAAFKADGAEAAARLIYSDLNLDAEEILAMWSQLPSDVRNQSKKHKEQFSNKKAA